MNLEKTAEKLLANVGDLPAMPEVVSEVLRLTDDPDTAMAQVSDVIQRDPALTAKILKVSNSPYYGMKQYVGTLKLAIVILGVREVRNIVLGISVFTSLSNERTKALFAKGFWEHSLKVGALTKLLATEFNLNLQGEDFIAGLLHDIGKMVLWRQLGQQYADIFQEGEGCGAALRKLEQERLGFDHADAATVLASKWNLPDTLAHAMFCHHRRADRDLRQAKDPRLASAVRIANLASRDDFSGDSPASAKACRDEDAWRELSTTGRPMAVADRFALLKTFRAEVDDMPTTAFHD